MKCNWTTLLGVIIASQCHLLADEVSKPHDLAYRKTETFTEYEGVEIQNLQGEKLGIVRDMTVDLENARLVDVIVSTGGFLGMGARIRTVDPRALTLDYRHHVLRLDASKAKLEGAPGFRLSDPETFSQTDRIAKMNRYFGLKPWFFLDGQTVVPNAEILQLRHVELATHIIRLPVMNREAEYLGRVGALTMDLPLGRVTHVILVTNAAESPRSSVQPRALRYNESGTALILDNSQNELAGQPHFKWVRGNQTAFQQESYVNRAVDADGGTHSTQNANEGLVAQSTEIKKGLNFRDEQKTSRILEAIQKHPELAANAKNVEVVTLNAQTTLRGHVDTAEEKQKIGEIAAQAGRDENVSNLIIIRPLHAPSRE